MLHRVEGDQGPRPAQACLAVDCDRPCVRLGEESLTRAEELVDNVLGWCRAVDEEHVFVLNSLVNEAVFVVLGVVQSDHFTDFQVLKNVNVACS